MIKSITLATSAAALMIAAAAPAQAQMSGLNTLTAPNAGQSQLIHKTGKKGRRIAGAIALGLIGAAVIAGSARANAERDDEDDAHEYRCNRWRRWCNEGEDRACRKYENRC